MLLHAKIRGFHKPSVNSFVALIPKTAVLLGMRAVSYPTSWFCSPGRTAVSPIVCKFVIYCGCVPNQYGVYGCLPDSVELPSDEVSPEATAVRVVITQSCYVLAHSIISKPEEHLRLVLVTRLHLPHAKLVRLRRPV